MSPSFGSTSQNNRRLDLLDGWRTLAVLCMIVWHFFWDLSLFGALDPAVMQRPLALAVRYFIVCSFVLLAGISSRFSRSNLRRGAGVLLCALVITLVTWLAGDPAWFGILHLLGCCMLLYAALGRFFRALPENAACLVCLALFTALFFVTDRVRVQVPWLWALGFRTAAFASSDYYPLCPWAFLFLAGTVLGGRLRRTEGAWKQVRLPPAFTWAGRHALTIYMIHQPVFLAGMYLIFRPAEGL